MADVGQCHPLNGWSLSDVLKTDVGPATSDMFGKLFYHVQSVFHSFYRHIAIADVEFQLFNFDAKELPGYIKGKEFARIEIATFFFLAQRYIVVTRS